MLPSTVTTAEQGPGASAQLPEEVAGWSSTQTELQGKLAIRACETGLALLGPPWGTCGYAISKVR